MAIQWILFLLISIGFCAPNQEKKTFLAKHSFSTPLTAQDIPFWSVHDASVEREGVILSRSPGTSATVWNDFILGETPNWEAVVTFSVSGGSLSGDGGLAFWYTKEKYPNGETFGLQNSFTGVGVIFALEGGTPVVLGVQNFGATFTFDRSPRLGSCHTELNSDLHSKTLRVRFNEGQLSVHVRSSYPNGPGDWQPCFTTSIYLPAGYYFGVSSRTGPQPLTYRVYEHAVYSVEEPLPTANVNAPPANEAPKTKSIDELKAELELLKAKFEIEKLQNELEAKKQQQPGNNQQGSVPPQDAAPHPDGKVNEALERLRALRHKKGKNDNFFRRDAESYDFNWKKDHQDDTQRLKQEETLAQTRQQRLEKLKKEQEASQEHKLNDQISVALEAHIREQEQFEWDLEDFETAAESLYSYLESNIHEALRTLQNEVLSLVPEVDRSNSVNPSIESLDQSIRHIRIALDQLKGRIAETSDKTRRVGVARFQTSLTVETARSPWDRWVWIIVIEIVVGVVYYVRNLKQSRRNDFSLG